MRCVRLRRACIEIASGEPRVSLATVDVESPKAGYRAAAHEENVAPRPAVARDTPFIVLAAYNESATIHHVVLELTARYRNVVVVDDGSTDGTFALARAAGAAVLRHVVNRGQGAALQTGIEYSLARGAACIVTFDSDGQHRADDIPVLIEPIERGECDIVLGSRFLGSTENMPRSRRWVLKAGVWFTRFTSGLAVTDAHNGLRAFSRRAGHSTTSREETTGDGRSDDDASGMGSAYCVRRRRSTSSSSPAAIVAGLAGSARSSVGFA